MRREKTRATQETATEVTSEKQEAGGRLERKRTFIYFTPFHTVCIPYH